jgi:hypothetical protein
VAAKVGRDYSVSRGELRHGERPVQVGAGEEAMHEQNHGRAAWPRRLTDEGLAAARQADESTRRHLVGELQLVQVEPLQTGAPGSPC